MDWDPVTVAARQILHKPSAACLRRLASEIAGFKEDPLPGVNVWPDENYATLVHALVRGPEGTPYEGGLFHFVLYAKANYPHEAPLARLMTTGQGTVRFNPQFYTSGKVCLSILHTWPGPGWNPSFTLRVVLLQLQALMNDQPALNEPGVMIMSNPEDYNAYLRHETLRVAVLGLLEHCSHRVFAQKGEEEEEKAPEAGEAPPMPRELAEVALAVLLQDAAKAEQRCRELAAKTPDGSMLPGVPRAVRAEYSGMASRLRALRSRPSGQDRQDQSEESGEPEEEEKEASGVAAETAPDMEETEEPECRICGGGSEDGELLQPCGCSGSMAYVHRACAAEWIRRNQSPVCPICGQAYRDPVLRTLGMLGRYRRRCVELGKLASCVGVAVACLIFQMASSSGLMPVEIAPWELGRWRVEPAPRGEAESADPRGGTLLGAARRAASGRTGGPWELPGPSEPLSEEQALLIPDDGNVPDLQLAPPYRLSGRWLRPALDARDRWREPLVQELVFHPLTPWSTRTIPVPVRFEALARQLQQRRFFQKRPARLTSVLSHWQKQTAAEQVRRQSKKEEPNRLGRGRGYIGPAAALRCWLRDALEPAPAVTVQLRPPLSAAVAASLVLFAWQAVGARSFFWMLMCCHLGSRWFPFPLVAATAVSANLIRYQVKRRLARLNMMRIRSQLESDTLILLLLLFGASCAGEGQGGIGGVLHLASQRGKGLPTPAELQDRPLSASAAGVSWTLLVLVSLAAMTTVARRPLPPEGAPPQARGLEALGPLLHGLLWAACGALLCLTVAAPVLTTIVRGE
ncbi:ube2z [Symbiodinium sp. KB8]|nr:ube2z [Symbiodinium sp. KB8]